MALLREIYGSDIENVTIEKKFRDVCLLSTLPTGFKMDITLVHSKYHIEMNPSDSGLYDRYVVQNIIKEMAENRVICFGPHHSGKPKYKTLVLNQADHLTVNAQQSLRRTMEKYISTCRLLMSCTNVSKIMEPVRSRCLSLRISAPCAQSITTMLREICEKENVDLSHKLASRIVETASGNLRRSLLTLEACLTRQYPLLDEMRIPLGFWEILIEDITREMFKQQSKKTIKLIRDKLHELLGFSIPPEVFFLRLLYSILPKLDEQSQHQVIKIITFYQHRVQCGSKIIFHLEACMVGLLTVIQRCIADIS